MQWLWNGGKKKAEEFYAYIRELPLSKPGLIPFAVQLCSRTPQVWHLSIHMNFAILKQDTQKKIK